MTVLFVTGIPPTEAQALASRGDDYRQYQRTTSAFVPWFPKPLADDCMLIEMAERRWLPDAAGARTACDGCYAIV